MPDPAPADYRFLLANERTFLAYVRTALALQVAGFAVLQFLTEGYDFVRLLLGMALILVGSVLAGVGLRRFRFNDAAIRSGGELASSRVPLALAAVIVIAPVIAGVLLVLG